MDLYSFIFRDFIAIEKTDQIDHIVRRLRDRCDAIVPLPSNIPAELGSTFIVQFPAVAAAQQHRSSSEQTPTVHEPSEGNADCELNSDDDNSVVEVGSRRQVTVVQSSEESLSGAESDVDLEETGMGAEAVQSQLAGAGVADPSPELEGMTEEEFNQFQYFHNDKRQESQHQEQEPTAHEEDHQQEGNEEEQQEEVQQGNEEQEEEREEGKNLQDEHQQQEDIGQKRVEAEPQLNTGLLEDALSGPELEPEDVVSEVKLIHQTCFLQNQLMNRRLKLNTFNQWFPHHQKFKFQLFRLKFHHLLLRPLSEKKRNQNQVERKFVDFLHCLIRFLKSIRSSKPVPREKVLFLLSRQPLWKILYRVRSLLNNTSRHLNPQQSLNHNLQFNRQPVSRIKPLHRPNFPRRNSQKNLF